MAPASDESVGSGHARRAAIVDQSEWTHSRNRRRSLNSNDSGDQGLFNSASASPLKPVSVCNPSAESLPCPA
jgi:hypothetical protein